MKTVFYDIEVFRDFFLVSFLVDGGFVDFSFHEGLSETTLKDFVEFIKKLRKEKTVCVGYNTLRYDNQIISFVVNGMQKTLDDVFNFNLRCIKEETFPDDIKLNCLDLIPFFKIGSHFKSLKEVGADLGVGNVMECPVNFEKEETTVEETKTITEYCHNDVLLTKSIFESEKVRDEIAVRKLLSSKYEVPEKKALTRSVGALSDMVIDNLLGEYEKKEPLLNFGVNEILDERLSYATDTFKEVLNRVSAWQIRQSEAGESVIDGLNGLEVRLGRGVLKIGLGGIHYNTEDVFVFKDDNNYILDIDVKSYYPSLIRNLNLGPEGIEKEYSGVFRKLMDLRDNAKTKGESALFKLVLNSATGKLKSKFSLFYSPKCNNSVTINGQMIMMELIEALHGAGFVFAQINTDGLSVFMDESRRVMFDDLVKAWRDKWGFITTEAKYHKVAQRDVNNYVAIKDNGDKKTTGFFKTGNLNHFPIIIRAVEDSLINNISIEETIKKADNIKDFIRYAKRSKWQWNGEEKFNGHGVNRFYLSFKDNVLYSELPPLKDKKDIRLIKVEEHVSPANALSDVNIKDINRESYIKEANDNLRDYSNARLPVYDASCHIIDAVKDDKKTTKKDGKEIKSLLKDLGLWKGRGKKLSECPKCGSKSNAATLYEDHIYCFSCASSITLADLKEEIKTVSLFPQNTNSTGQKPLENLSDEWVVPDIVWQGYMADIAVAIGKKDVDTLFVGLASASMLIGRSIALYHGRGGRMTGAGYYLLLKRSGSGKSTTLGLIQKIIDQVIDYDSDVSSGQALFNMVSEPIYEGVGKAEKFKGYKPKNAALIIDEFSSLLSSIKISNSNLCDKLNELFHKEGKYTNNSLVSAKSSESKKTRQVVHNPILSIAGITTEKAFFAGISDNLKTKGFINRYLMFPGSDTKFDRVSKAGSDNVDVKRLKELTPLKTNSPYDSDVYTGDFQTEEVNQFLLPHVDRLLKQHNESGSDDEDIFSRYHTHLHRLTLMYGIMTGNNKPTVENAKAAVAIIELCERYTKQLFSRERDDMPINPYAEYKNRVEDMIIRYVEKHGKTSKADLKYQMKKRKISEGDFETTIKNLTAKEDSTLEILSERNDKNGLIVNFIDFRK